MPIPDFLALGLILIGFFLFRDKATKLPCLNPKKPFELSDKRAVSEFIDDSRHMLYNVARSFMGKHYRVLSDLSDVIILPPHIGDEIRNDKRFSFSEGLVEVRTAHALVTSDSQGRYAGFDAYKETCHPSQRLQNVVKRRLTKTLAKITEPLSEECEIITRETFKDNKEWHTVVLQEGILSIVARLLSRIFVDKELGRDPDIQAMQPLRLWPKILRPLVVWFLRGPTRLRAYLPDAIDWFQEIAKGERYNPGLSQLILGTVAIHTTSDLITQTVYDIMGNPDLIDDLRKEIVTAIGEGGWKKTSLYSLKLMDSVLKESQRLKPNQIANHNDLVGMHRRVMEDVVLSDGTYIARGSATAVSSEKVWDPSAYPDPNKFDGYRFYRGRENGADAANQLVTTSTSHMGLGHGMHSCPGRFFASDEAKVVLCHLLMKYDFKLAPGEKLEVSQLGSPLRKMLQSRF
ncbi:cytochrome P450 [Ilyonectria destructans]|nr:cytochrome P450 [Ilyonectria destructans]